MKMELELDNETIGDLEHVIKYFDISAEDVFKLGIKISRRFTGETFRDYIINSVKKSGRGLLNIIEIGKEFYSINTEKVFRGLGLKNPSIENILFTDEGCISAIDVEPGKGFYCNEIYIWNHERPLNIVLNYTYEKDQENAREWVEKLRDREDELKEILYNEYEDIDDVRVEIDEDEEMYYIHIIIALGELIKIKKIEKKIYEIIGKTPKK